MSIHKYHLVDGKCEACINMFPREDGSAELVEPKKNAVIVHIIPTEYKQVVRYSISIECIDESMLETLTLEAKVIHRFLSQNEN